MNGPAPIPFTRRLDREPKIEEMACALIRLNEEAGEDIRNSCVAYQCLRAAMYTDGQISAFGETAIDRARARLQIKAGIDTAMSAIGIGMAGLALFFGWVGYAGEAQAAILSPAGVEAGGDVWLAIVSLIVGLYVGHKIGWLQYGRRLKVCAPYPEEDDHDAGAFDYRNARQ
jgi:hypothetical protein